MQLEIIYHSYVLVIYHSYVLDRIVARESPCIDKFLR